MTKLSKPDALSLRRKIKGDVLFDKASLGLYATDASLYQIWPKIIVLPKTENDVSQALKFARKNSLAILPRGGGTSLAGQTVGDALVLDFSKYFDQVLEVNKEEKWARVQPGLVRDVLNQKLLKDNLIFAPDPATSSRANIGGMIGNNSSGTKSILYGKTIDHVLGLKIQLYTGEIISLTPLDSGQVHFKCLENTCEGKLYKGFKDIIMRHSDLIEERFPKVMRRVGGYNLDEFITDEKWNLAKVICGSEGTLATILEAKINLEKLPKYKAVCVVHFNDLDQSITAVEEMLNFKPAAIEILDETVLQLSRENLLTQRACHFIEGEPKAIQIVEFYGDEQQEIKSRAEAMIKALKDRNWGYAYPFFEEGPSYEDVWTIRKKGLGLMLGIKGNKKPLAFIEDACIPIKHLPTYIREVLAVCKSEGTEAAMYAHASVGVIHVRPILDLRLAEDIERLQNIARKTFDLVVKYGGSWSGEHGDGLVRSPFNQEFFGDKLYKAFKKVKFLFDPHGKMNPGKIVGAPSMDQNLRYGTSYQDQAIQTHFKYRQEETFQEAIHMCTGVGECRKTTAGTMCPSFQATRDEEHSTRGRANILRLAMSGQLGQNALASERVQSAMDLCLSCKACKAECPSNVDMAKLKAETRQAYLEKNGLSFRDKMIERSAELSQKISGSFAAPLLNWLMNSKLAEPIKKSILKLDPSKPLPKYSEETFFQWQGKQSFAQITGKSIFLFIDTYSNYHETHIAKAAYLLLRDLGYDVITQQIGCCQRPRISNGFLAKAKHDGSSTLNNLQEIAKPEIPIVCIEPSCASALKDDLPDLLEKQYQLGKVMMVEELLVELLDKDEKPPFRFKSDKLLFHAHCHQEAIFGKKHLQKLIDQQPELLWIDSKAGCCGMAGSFGYELEHSAISEKLAKSRLIPLVKQNTDADLLACGHSCRHQIEHFAGRKPQHLVELLEVIKP